MSTQPQPTNKVIAIVNLIGGLVSVFGPIALDLALKIKSLFEQSQLGSVDIKAVGDQAITADDQTMADINAWMEAHGFPTLPPA